MTTKPKMPPLYFAAINCPHSIDDQTITLQFDSGQPGHNALDQLGKRLDAVMSERVAELEREKETVLQDRVALAMRVEELERVLGVARETLDFYADGDHFIRHDADAWDTVSGEPPNFYEDEANTATVEDGSLAKQAIATIDAARSKEGQHHD